MQLSVMESSEGTDTSLTGSGAGGPVTHQLRQQASHSVSPLPQDSALLSPTLPLWAREVGAAFAVRPSRASSIISTRTRFSTTTLQDDARSIDINLGGQYFRISRDGSSITSEVPPPPYPGESSTISHQRSRQRSIAALNLTQSQHNNRNQLVQARIFDPSEIDVPSPVEGLQSSRQGPLTLRDAATGQHDTGCTTADVPSRNPSYKSGEETITLADGRERRTVSQSDLPDLSIPLRRRNGVRLPTLITDPQHQRRKEKFSPSSATVPPHSAGPRHCYSQSAGPILSSGQQELNAPQSPTFIGRQATGVFPVSNADAHQSAGGEEQLHPSLQSIRGLALDSTPQDSEEENSISMHYTRMIRFIDRDHRRVLHAKDKELAELRERLNEVDTVYRQELKARDFIIDDLKKRLSHLEESTEVMLEKARNEVEDTWEHRWKDQEFKLRQTMRRLEAEAHSSANKSSESPFQG